MKTKQRFSVGGMGFLASEESQAVSKIFEEKVKAVIPSATDEQIAEIRKGLQNEGIWVVSAYSRDIR
ncbi:MAG: hypothetical protein LRY76_05960 [Alphaproteobacteria bacterium]|nr:hypothetical protein [Alphaproteobacteria bacterium]